MGSRIVFARFPSRDSYRLQPWNEHSRLVTGREPGTSRSGERDALVWQLESANNRQLARCSMVHSTVMDAVDDASTIVDDPAGEVLLVRKDGVGAFGWYLATRFRILVVCPRWYPTERERKHSIELALAALPGAAISSAVRLIGSDRTVELSELGNPPSS